MTISNPRNTETFNGNDVATSFPFSVLSQFIADVKATHIDTNGVRTKLVQGTDYSVVLNADKTSTITFPLGASSFSTLATGEDLEASRLPPLTQATELDNQGPYDAEAVEGSLDKITQLVQSIIPDCPEGAGRSIFFDTDCEMQLGPLQSSIDSAIASTSGIITVTTIAALKALAIPADNTAVTVLGYTVEGDEGGGIFFFDELSTDTDNLGTVIIPDSAPAAGRWVRLIEGEVNIKMFGAVGDGATNDTASIQATYDYVIGLGKHSKVIWPAANNYLWDQFNIHSLFEVHTFAYGARFVLNFSGGAAVSMAGAHHSWHGGRPAQADQTSGHHPRMFDIIQTAGFSNTSGIKIYDMHARDVYQFANVFMDVTTFPAAANFRHTFQNCQLENFINGGKAWAGSYGIRLDGDTANNSGGNDTKLIDVLITGFETNLYTNGVRTQWIGGSCDGAIQGVELDGCDFFASANCYFEFNNHNYKYSNSPTNPASVGCSYANEVTGFSTGALGAGQTNGRHRQVADLGTSITEQLTNTFVQTGSADCHEAETATGTSFRSNVTSTGKGFALENSGTEIGFIGINSGVLILDGAATGGLHFAAITIRPKVTQATSFGNASFEYKDIFLLNAPTVSSDREKKFDIEDCELGLSFVMELKPSSFKLKGGTSGRTHYGLISQDVEKALRKLGVNPDDFAGFIKSPRTEDVKVGTEKVNTAPDGEEPVYEDRDVFEENLVTDKDGNQLYDYALRYEEFIPSMILSIQELSARLDKAGI